MDVQANPGPATLPNSGRQTANLIHIPPTDNIPKLYYSRDQLMSFRPSCFSTKRLSPQLIRQLKYLNILKYRGKSGGTRVNKAATKIPIINKERFILQHNLIRRANLHNLRSLNRCSNVNICDHNERSFIPVTERSGSGLKVLHLNIRSLPNISHLSQLRELNSREQSDIITISESWLNTTITSTEIQLDGYKLFRLDRLHKGGGGVCAYVRSELKSKVLKDFSSISDRNFHQLWLSVQVKKSKSIVLCVAYRPDDTPLSFFEDTLKPVYTQALLLNKPIIILGNLNCDGLDSSCREYAAINSFTREMNPQQLIKEPTRITATTESLLDVILVSDPLSGCMSGVINDPISDHLPVHVVLKLKSPKISPHYVSVRSYKNYDPENFTFDLASHSDSLLSVFAAPDVNSKLGIFNNAFRQVLDAHAPVKTVKIRSRPCPFVTEEIKDLMKIRSRLHRRFLLTRNEFDWAEYKISRNSVRKALTEAEKHHTYQEVQNNMNNSRSLWKVINNIVPSKTQEKLVYSKDLKTVANEFNSYFSSVGSRTAEAVAKLALENNIICSNSSHDAIVQMAYCFFFRIGKQCSLLKKKTLDLIARGCLVSRAFSVSFYFLSVTCKKENMERSDRYLLKK